MDISCMKYIVNKITKVSITNLTTPMIQGERR